MVTVKIQVIKEGGTDAAGLLKEWSYEHLPEQEILLEGGGPTIEYVMFAVVNRDEIKPKVEA